MNTASLVLAAAIALAAPLVYAAMGELISETGGVINIQLEGMMLCGALAGVWAAAASQNVAVGFVGAAVAGMALAALHGLLSFVLGANQVVSGVVLNILALGGTAFLSSSAQFSELSMPATTLSVVEIPLLSDIPVLGSALFEHDLLVYLAYLLVPVLMLMRRRTTVGLALTAVGERPDAAAALGLSVLRVRWSALIVCGALAGFGGGQLVLAGLGRFTENVTAGQGFIALAAVVFGRWRPLGTLAAVLLFAVTQAIQVRSQVLGLDVPSELLIALPYIVTILALAGFLRSMRPPAALGVAYRRQ